MHDFANATILVTGAASGIGAASARLLHQRSARLILVDRDDAKLATFAASLDGDHRSVAGDVTDEGLWDGLDLAGLTHAFVNAGIGAGGPIEQLGFDEWRRVLAINLDGAFLTLRAAMRAIRATGRGGAILITSSAAGLRAEPGIAAYAASKAAVIQLARVAAREGAAAGIRVNSIAPGGVETPIWSGMPFFTDLVDRLGGEAAAFAEMAKMATPLGRYGKAEEIAEQVAFLLSDACGFVTGSCFVNDGGYTL